MSNVKVEVTVKFKYEWDMEKRDLMDLEIDKLSLDVLDIKTIDLDGDDLELELNYEELSEEITKVIRETLEGGRA